MAAPIDAVAANHNQQGLDAAARGDLTAAEGHFRMAVAGAPAFAQAHNNLGVALEMQGRLAEAEQAYRQALVSRPDYADAWQNLGVVLERLERFELAEAACRRALALRPGSFTAANGLAVALMRLNRLDEAAALLERLVAEHPQFASAHSNLGAVQEKQGRLDAAARSLEQAIALEPENVGALVNAGLLYDRMRNLARATQLLNRAIALDPNSAEARFNLGLLHLRDGEFAAGWQGYRWRSRLAGQQPTRPPLPEWDGSPLEGRTILLCEDQGAGDSIMFVRFAGMLAEQGARVIVSCSRSLANLLATCPGVAAVVPKDAAWPSADAYAQLGDLPELLGIELANLPAPSRYLSAPAALAHDWSEELGSVKELKVGIAWQGNPQNKADRERSIALQHFRQLIETPGTRFYSLQFDAGREQIWQVESRLIDLGDRLGQFHETAALVANLDLVITCDSAPAHLAGALGVPVWVALANFADWRWMRDRRDSPWYPAMRLFRQTVAGHWEPVFEQLQSELDKLLGARTAAAHP